MTLVIDRGRDRGPGESALTAGRMVALSLVVGIGLVASGCMSSRNDFAQTGSVPRAAQPPAQPLVLTGAQQVGTGPAGANAGTVAGSETQAVSAPPMALSDPQPQSQPASGQPDSKLLSPEEKARLVAELEALAKSQDARAAAGDAACEDNAPQPLDPEQGVNRDFAAGEC